MFSQVFLAVTHREMETFCPKRTAYMACHFSPGGKGLSNLPRHLPAGSILLLDDSMPVQGHSKEAVVQQLQELACAFDLQAILLDFQRPQTEQASQMATAILQGLPCCVAVPPMYATEHPPVFLPPPPVNKPLGTYLHPWLKQGVFLEIAPETARFTITKDGCAVCSVPWEKALPQPDPRLHCHYRKEVSPGKVVFTITRTLDDLAALSREACDLGALGTVGLYQELTDFL